MKRVLSGIQPSGQLHIGNYFGMMSRVIQYKEQNELYCFIVDYHALTTINDRKRLETNTLNAAMDFLALGLDPDKSIFWIQSDVPQVTELTWLLSTVTGMGLLERATSYKDKTTRGITPNLGLFSYPVLMAADILCFGADIVPVGKDQKQHLEMTRDIAQRFNEIHGDVFKVPEADINKSLQLIPKPRSSATEYPEYLDLVRRQLKRDYRDDDLRSEGLQIFTSFDPHIQWQAELSLKTTIASLEKQRKLPAKKLQGTVVVTSSDQGEILAWVGGRDVRQAGFKQNWRLTKANFYINCWKTKTYTIVQWSKCSRSVHYNWICSFFRPSWLGIPSTQSGF